MSTLLETPVYLLIHVFIQSAYMWQQHNAYDYTDAHQELQLM